MRFLFLLYGDEAAELALTAEERRELVRQHQAFARELAEGGRLVAGEAVTPSREAAVIRRSAISDGPFAETKEQLGGFYVVECADRAEALELARRLPESPGSLVEVRPIAET